MTGLANGARAGHIVVTGVAGFVGSHLAEALLSEGYQVVGVDAFTSYYSPAEKRANLAGVTGHRCFRLIDGDVSTIRLDDLLPGAHAVSGLGEPRVAAVTATCVIILRQWGHSTTHGARLIWTSRQHGKNGSKRGGYGGVPQETMPSPAPPAGGPAPDHRRSWRPDRRGRLP